MGLLGKRWTGLILRALFSGCDRFGSIADYVPGLSDKVLSERLKELEGELGKLKRMYADLALENRALKDLIEKKL